MIDPELAKIGNAIVDRLEQRGEDVIVLENLQPFAISTHQVDGKAYRKAVIVGRNMINDRGNPKWIAKEKIAKFLKNGYNQVMIVSKNSKTGRQRILNFNSKGLMFDSMK